MEQIKKFEVIPAGDVTNPPQAPIPVVEMLLAQARVIACRRALASQEIDDPELWREAQAELENALADLAEMELHQLKWNIIQANNQRMVQEATILPPGGGFGPGHGGPPKIKM